MALRNPKRIFVTGLLAILPLFVTGTLLLAFLHWINGPVGSLVQILLNWLMPVQPQDWVSGIYRTTLGVVLTLAINLLAIFLVGLLANNIVGARMLRSFEQMLLRLPIVSSIYSPAKQLFRALSDEATGEREVVAVEFPRPGLFMIGFVTRRDDFGVTVFLPTAPNPTSGFLVICEARQVTSLPMPFDEAMQMIVSGGFVGPGAAVLREKLGVPLRSVS